jgi:predicted oxidoreductase
VAHDAFTNGDIAFLQERGIAPMAWSPLAGGRLLAESGETLRNRLTEIGAAHGTDWSAAAVAWLLHHPARIIPVMGTNSLARIATIGAAMDVKLDRQTWFELYTLVLGHEVA